MLQPCERSALVPKTPRASFCGFSLSRGRANKLCVEFSNTVGSDSVSLQRENFQKGAEQTCDGLVSDVALTLFLKSTVCVCVCVGALDPASLSSDCEDEQVVWTTNLVSQAVL